jgi:hypothetical protein
MRTWYLLEPHFPTTYICGGKGVFDFSPLLVMPKPHLAADANLGLILAIMEKISNQSVEHKKPKTGS